MTSVPGPIVLAHSDDHVLSSLRDALGDRTEVVATCRTCADLESQYQRQEEGLVVTGVAFPDGNALEVLVRLSVSQPLPAVIVTDRSSLSLVERAAEDTVMAYLVTPFEQETLLAALVLAQERHRQILELQREVQDLRQALTDRKIIERAKGVLMARHGLTEAEAFDRLRTEAQRQRKRIVQVAESSLSSEGAV